MNNNTLTSNVSTTADRFGRSVAAHLTENTANLPHVVTERLRASRAQSVAMRKRGASVSAFEVPAGVATVATAGGVVAGGVVAGGVFGSLSSGATTLMSTLGRWFDAPDSDDFWWSRLGSVVPLVALVAGIWIASGRSDEVRIAELAQVDAAILADDLPPAAYVDPGFAQYLRDNRSADYR